VAKNEQSCQDGGTTLSVMTLSIMTLSIMTLSITTFSIKTLSMRAINTDRRYAQCLSFMLPVANKPIVLSVVIPNVVMPSAIMLSVVAPLINADNSIALVKSRRDRHCSTDASRLARFIVKMVDFFINQMNLIVAYYEKVSNIDGLSLLLTCNNTSKVS
jgi:hypothetical protein